MSSVIEYLSERSLEYARSYYPDIVFPRFEQFMNLGPQPKSFSLYFCYLIIALFHKSKLIMKKIVKVVS